MMSESSSPQRWPASRWWTLIGVVLGAQLVLIFWLGKPHIIPPPRADSVPTLHLTGPGAASVLALTDPTLVSVLSSEGFFGPLGSDSTGVLGLTDPKSAAAAEVLALTDPTLFALPHVQGFSGAAWLIFSPTNFNSFAWADTPRYLDLGERQLGSEFKDFMATNQFEALSSLRQQELELKMPTFEQQELLPSHSRVLLAGDLANRHLVATPDLPAWPGREVLTNSVVTLLVNADGLPVSAPTLLPPGSGSPEADDRALDVARHARFNSLKVADPTQPMAGLAWGHLIFEWRTVPLSLTNPPIQSAPSK